MELIRVIVEQEIGSLGAYETKYRKALLAIDDSDDSEEISQLQRLDCRIATIRSWFGCLSIEEYLVVTASLVEKRPLTEILKRYKETYGYLPQGDDESVYRYQDNALNKISQMIYEEFESAHRFAESLGREI